MYEIFERLLEERGITAYRVAKETGVSTATLTGWKQGKYTPKQDKLQKIAEYFNVSVFYLMGVTDEPTGGSQLKFVSQIEFGRLIQLERESQNLTQKQLANMINVSKSVISEFESGVMTFEDNTLEKITSALGYSLNEFKYKYFVYDIIDKSDKKQSENDENLNNTYTQTPNWATSKDKRDLKRIIEDEAPLMFDGIPIEGEKRESVMSFLTGLFWEAKEMNKKTYGRKKKHDESDNE